MEAKTFLILPAVFLGGWASAQTNSSPASPPAPSPVVETSQPGQPNAPDAASTGATSGDKLDPAKIAEYQKRFEEGYALEQQGRLVEARKIYDGILAEEPNAKRSLLEAGKISFKLGELTKADKYLEKLHEQVPDFPEAIELLIQINQALKYDVKAELLIRDFKDLHDSGTVPALSQSLWFVRERIHHEKLEIVVSQSFDYTQDPNTAWMAEVFDESGSLQRRILLNYEPEATRALRTRDVKYANTEVFTWREHKIKAGQPTEIDVYLQIFALPDYQKFRSAMLIILANPPKPIYSVPVNPPQH